LVHVSTSCVSCSLYPFSCRDQQGATAFEMCIGDAARGLLQDKETALQEAGHSGRAQPRSRPESRCVHVDLQGGQLAAAVVMRL
jgi:hypothetical protein